MNNVFKIGTRNSPLAMIQAEMVKTALKEVHPELDIEIISIRSNADWNKGGGEVPLSEEAGGKGMFATEIEAMIADGSVDCGVHSLKDMATDLPNHLVINHVLPRADVRDALISTQAETIKDLPQGAVIGTCSPRRAAFALHERPDLKIVPFRGNVGTRIEKVKNGQVDATFLAMAGITRLGITDNIIHPMPVEDFLPACGQGVICIETRDGAPNNYLLNAMHCEETYLCAVSERAVLKVLDGSCQTPIAAHATIKNNLICLTASVLSEDGQFIEKETLEADCKTFEDAESLGEIVGKRLKNKT